jgi:uncharacterized membrane protein YhfC
VGAPQISYGEVAGVMAFWLVVASYFLVAIATFVAARRTFHAPRYLLVMGGLVIIVSSAIGAVIGYQLGVHVFHIGKQSHVILRVLPFYTAALLEEAARVVALYWLSRRGSIGDAVTFGVGFAGFEAIKKALFDLPLSMSFTRAVFSTVLCVEIFIFHIALTVLLYRVWRDDHSPSFKAGIISAAILYHVLIDFCGATWQRCSARGTQHSFGRL